MQQDSALTLSEVAYYGRLVMKYGAVVLATLLVGKMFLSAAVGFWIATHPAPPPPPEVRFGRLPTLNFPVQTTADKPTSYQLQTATGTFPNFGDRAQVFFMPPSSPSLLADQQVKTMAANYGFMQAPTQLNSRTSRWTKAAPVQATLDIDTQNFTFTLLTDYLSRPELLGGRGLPNQFAADTLVKSYLSSGPGLPPDMATVSAQVTYLKSLGRDLGPAISISDADFVQIDLQRLPIDKTKQFYTAKGTYGIVHAIAAGTLTGLDQIVELEDRYHPIDYLTHSTYPLRSVAQAWQVLQAGEGYVVNKGQTPAAVIRDVFLGYYDDFNEQKYMQPIYVFVGDGGFLGYVPAVDPSVVDTGTGAATVPTVTQ